MELTKLLRQELLVKCEDLGITKYTSKNKSQLIELINSKHTTHEDSLKNEIQDYMRINGDPEELGSWNKGLGPLRM